MMSQLQVSDAEQQLILQLLQAERRQLPEEIHHTDNPDVHDRLQEKLVVLDRLIDRLQSPGQRPA